MAALRKTTVEDEDLDDLDDVLEQFNAPPKPAPAPPPASSSKSPPSAPPKEGPSPPPPDSFGMDGLDEDFARELTKGMESLFRDIAMGAGLDDVPDLGKEPEGTTDEEQEKAFRAAWEAMLVEGMNGTMNPEDLIAPPGAGAAKAKTTGAANGAASGSGSNGGPPQSFQDNIKRAMDKMKESNQMADEAASKSGDSLEDLFSRISGDLDSTESEEDLKGILETMMSQLMSKDVLYEPLKELHDKFPGYLKDHASTLSSEDKTRYEGQSKIVAEIVATFEDPSFKDDDPQKSLKVVELMQEMQEHGSPPSEIMGPLPPGFDLGADGLPKLPDGCTIA
ncbi:transporter [Ganoderma sinense ZZ0214-1]|uniref:Transporter n=1 Tax=Ganoderma sinense ZZ0214-1 TaxID=1077348 RepID=A0A2G8RZZ2_9APHY|nr:transporter [Ganoderma sinense ZZ0214-1]